MTRATLCVRYPITAEPGLADHDGDTIDRVNGDFEAGSIFVAVTPCDAGNAPPTCPAPGFPPNYLGMLGPWTGHMSKVMLPGPRLGRTRSGHPR